MSQLVIITTPEELEKTLKKVLGQSEASKVLLEGQDEALNQVQAALFCGVTEATMIRWKKKKLIRCEQLPGSSKITYYKSRLKEDLERNREIFGKRSN
jgi:hypothetical protein